MLLEPRRPQQGEPTVLGVPLVGTLEQDITGLGEDHPAGRQVLHRCHELHGSLPPRQPRRPGEHPDGRRLTGTGGEVLPHRQVWTVGEGDGAYAEGHALDPLHRPDVTGEDTLERGV